MKIIITENKLQSLFNGMMSEYTDMVDHERDYDYYDYTPENETEATTILVTKYINQTGNRFYTVQVGMSVSHEDHVAKVYILSGKQYDSLGNMFQENPGDFSDKDVDLGEEEIEKGL